MSDKAAKTPEANRTRDQERKPRAEEQVGPDLVAGTVSVAGGAGEPTPTGNGVALLQREARPAGRGYSGAQAQMLLQLQRTRGNQAALRLLQRSQAKPQPQADTLEAGDDVAVDDLPHAGEPPPNGQPSNGLRVQRLADCPPPPPKAEPLPPQADPKFKAIESKVKQVAGQEKKHAPAKAKAAEAQAASVPPANETSSQAKAGQVDTMAEKKPGAFDKKAFVAAVKQAIEAASPKNLDEASNFKDSGRAAQVKGQVSGMVTQNKETAQGDIKQATQAAPDASKAKPKEVKPMDKEQAGPTPAPVPAQSGMPSPKSAAETSLQSGKCEVDGMMKEAKVSDEQLAKSNEPQFKESLDAKKAQAEHADTAPKQVKQEEQKILGQAQAEAGKTAQQGVGGMHASRTGALGKLDTGKSDAKAKDEKARAEFSHKIEAIYAKTKTDVEAILKGLDGKVDQAFNQGEQAARTAFENYVKTRTDKFEDERYSGVGGKLQWVADRFSAPAELNQFVDEGRQLYLNKMNGVIDSVASIIETELNAAKARIAKGRQDIQAEVTKLPKHLQKEGAEAASKFEGQFDELDQQVDNKSEEMVQTLADKYVAAREAVDERVNAMKEANKGLYDRAKDAVKGVIDTILKLKDMLLNVLSRAAGIIDKIIKDPIGFLGNLVSAVKAGLNQFMSNIGKHLLDGLMGWLFGELGSAGIQFPSTLDFKGVLSLVMQLLGLTWANIRARAVKIVGETVMARIEQVAEVFKILVTEGPAGLWKFIQDKISDLKETVIGGIMDFVKDKIIVAGVTWLIGLLNPAAAFIKACKAIYDVVMFFIERGSQIMEFVNSILDSLEAIVGGNVSSVAGLIEKTLARILPLAISFLASLLGVGGIGEKIKKIIQAVQKPINKAIDAVIKPVLNLAKKGAKWLGGKVKAGAAWVKKKAKQAKEWGKKKIKQAKDWAKKKVTQAKDWAKKKLGIKDKEKPAEKKPVNPAEAFAAAEQVITKGQAEGASPKELNAQLAPLKAQYGFKKLKVVTSGQDVEIDAEINPVKVWKYGGKIKLKLIYDPTWPLDEFLSKAKAIQKAATAGKCKTLPLDPKTGKQKKTGGQRKGGQTELREKIRTFILTRVPAADQANLLTLLTQLEADHQQELQMEGGDKGGNLAMIEGAFNNQIGWFDLGPALRALPPGTVIDEVIIDTSAAKTPGARKSGAAAELRAELLKHATGAEKLSIYSWFKLED
ncbi:MAG: hypothetical protein KIT87_13310 [Anaerolineae bacterium]|nr:hypothetical protein [Anaerolineae bacterium]